MLKDGFDVEVNMPVTLMDLRWEVSINRPGATGVFRLNPKQSRAAREAMIMGFVEANHQGPEKVKGSG